MNESAQNENATARRSDDSKTLLSIPFLVLLVAQLAIVPWRNDVGEAPRVYAPVWAQQFHTIPADMTRMQGARMTSPHRIDARLLVLQLAVTSVLCFGWLALADRRRRI